MEAPSKFTDEQRVEVLRDRHFSIVIDRRRPKVAHAFKIVRVRAFARSKSRSGFSTVSSDRWQWADLLLTATDQRERTVRAALQVCAEHLHQYAGELSSSAVVRALALRLLSTGWHSAMSEVESDLCLQSAENNAKQEGVL